MASGKKPRSPSSTGAHGDIERQLGAPTFRESETDDEDFGLPADYKNPYQEHREAQANERRAVRQSKKSSPAPKHAHASPFAPLERPPFSPHFPQPFEPHRQPPADRLRRGGDRGCLLRHGLLRPGRLGGRLRRERTALLVQGEIHEHPRAGEGDLEVKGLALATVGLWVILQTTYGPLATKIGLITSSTPSSPAQPGGNVAPQPQHFPGTTTPVPTTPVEPTPIR